MHRSRSMYDVSIYLQPFTSYNDRDIGRKLQLFSTPYAFNAPVWGVRVGIPRKSADLRLLVKLYGVLYCLFLSFAYVLLEFLTCVSHTAHVIDVCPSVRPSHAGIVSKWLNLSSNCLHCLVAPWFYSFLRTKLFSRNSNGNTTNGGV